jgi:hypothetical protein
MKITRCGGGYISTIPMSDIEYIGYFYGKGGNENIKNAHTRITKIRGSTPDFLMNAELFDFGTRKAASDVVCGGTIHRLTQGYGIAFPDNKKAIFSYGNNVKAKDYVGAYPVLIRNGKKESSIPSGIGGVRGRTAIGVNANNLFVALIPDGNNDVSLDTLRTAFINVGAENAINLDGGGSTQFYSPNGNHFTGRNVRGFIAIWLKKNSGDDVRVVNVRTNLRIRSRASILSSVVGKLYNGDVVTVLKTSGDWCKISAGWVHSKYLKKK